MKLECSGFLNEIGNRMENGKSALSYLRVDCSFGDQSIYRTLCRDNRLIGGRSYADPNYYYSIFQWKSFSSSITQFPGTEALRAKNRNL